MGIFPQEPADHTTAFSIQQLLHLTDWHRNMLLDRNRRKDIINLGKILFSNAALIANRDLVNAISELLLHLICHQPCGPCTRCANQKNIFLFDCRAFPFQRKLNRQGKIGHFVGIQNAAISPFQHGAGLHCNGICQTVPLPDLLQERIF